MRSSGWWRGLASGKPAVGAFSPGRCLWWAPQFCEFSQVGVCVSKSARADPAFVRASDVASQLKRNRKLEDTREPEQRANATKGSTRGTRFLVSRVRPLRVLLSLAGSYYYAVSLHMVGFARSSSCLYWLAWRCPCHAPLFNSDGLTLLHATSARAWFRRQRPATAAAGLSRLDIFPTLFYYKFLSFQFQVLWTGLYYMYMYMY